MRVFSSERRRGLDLETAFFMSQLNTWIIFLSETEEERMTAQFDLWLTNQWKGAFHSCPHRLDIQAVYIFGAMHDICF